MKREGMPALDPNGFPVPEERAAGHQLENPLIERSFPDRIAEQQVELERISVQRFSIVRTLYNGAEIRSVKESSVFRSAVLEGLYAESIPRAEKALPVLNRKGEGTVQMAYDLTAPAPPAGAEDFELGLTAIRARRKAKLAAKRNAVAQIALIELNSHKLCPFLRDGRMVY